MFPPALGYSPSPVLFYNSGGSVDPGPAWADSGELQVSNKAERPAGKGEMLLAGLAIWSERKLLSGMKWPRLIKKASRLRGLALSQTE